MQRTVKSMVFTYAKSTIEDGQLKSELAKVEVVETDERKAYKKAVKIVGNFAPLKVEIRERLYKLDDDIFFKYATVVE